ncbi:MAG: YcjF family protein [Methylococcaceae bacterium]|nr:YcjF family protein [Methylococcaceae bacterium]
METNDTTTDLEEKLSVCVRAEREARAQTLIKNYVLTSAGVALVPFPLVDLAGIMALQIKLVHGLAKHYDVPFKENLVKSLLTSLLSGATSVVGFLGLASLAKSVPVLGTLGGMGGVAITAGSVTYAVGQVFARHFESGGTLLDFDPQKMKSLFKRELKKGQEAAAEAKGNSTPTPA